MHPIETIVQRVANRLGLHITRVSKSTSGRRTYEPVLPRATYSPWNEDEEFQAVYRAIEGATLVDEYRCFELWKLIEQVSKLDAGWILEVGVWRGGTGALLARRAKDLGIGGMVLLCDTFSGVVKAGSEDSVYRGGEHADASRPAVEALVSRMGLDNVRILEGVFPEDTGHLAGDAAFRFCHIDVDVYQSAADVVDWVWDRLVPGGMIVFDDYGFKVCDGITKYVEAQMMSRDRLVIHNLNGHAIIIKL